MRLDEVNPLSADFQAKLQQAMERGRLRRTSSEAGLGLDAMDSQTSHLSSEPPTSVRRLGSEAASTTAAGNETSLPPSQQPLGP